MSLGSGHPPADAGPPRALKATVFVSDPSAEAERVAQALRTGSYLVVDVPLSMLVARVAVQRPRVILVDSDADGAVEAIARMRELPEADDIDVLFIGRAASALGTGAEDALAHESSGSFTRPVDVQALVDKIDALTAASHAGGETSESPQTKEAESAGELEGSQALPALQPTAASNTPPEKEERDGHPAGAPPPPPSIRADRPSRPPLSSIPPPPPSLPSMGSLGRVSQAVVPPSAPSIGIRGGVSVQGPLSNELANLLAEAEERIGVQLPLETALPSPEEEIEAVLPEEILAALDEPLEEEEDDDDLSDTGSQGRRTTSGGGTRHTTGTGTRRHTTSTGGASPPTNADLRSSPPAGTSGRTSPQAISFRGLTRDAVSEGATRSSDDGTQGQTGSWSAPFGAPVISAAQQSAQAALTAEHHSQRRGSSSTAPASPPSVLSATLGSEVLVQSLGNFDARPTAVHVSDAQAPQHPPTLPPVPANDAALHDGESIPPPMPSVLGPGDAPRALARAVATRVTGTLCFDSKEGVRRAVLREGDIVTCASGVDDESLLAFLGTRGDLSRERLNQLAGRFATFGRHAGAALVAHGYLRQDQLWPVLRAHAEWILGRVAQVVDGTAVIEPEPPGRLRGEPSVFGGSTGAEVLVEVVRRVVAPDEAIQRMGGMRSRIGEGPNSVLLTECALRAAEMAILDRGRGQTIEVALADQSETDMASVLYALELLGVVELLRSLGHEEADTGAEASRAEVDALDEDAIRARVRARLELVDEGDYFAFLGVSRGATGYEVRRAFLELRRSFDPWRLLTPRVADLAPDVRKIVMVLEEAYEILRDAARRERYRRAIDVVPGGDSRP